MNKAKFKVGDRVKRKILFSVIEAYRFGEIAEVYNSNPNHVGRTDIMYAVKWDDTGLTERGYLDIANGLLPA